MNGFDERDTSAQILLAAAMEEIARAIADGWTPESAGAAGDASGVQLRCECSSANEVQARNAELTLAVCKERRGSYTRRFTYQDVECGGGGGRDSGTRVELGCKGDTLKVPRRARPDRPNRA